ncbi:U-scoloptoxin(19)-Sm1a [Procambarus clarkii]|uniref:U-scoloptoxin(19)-Sm1a n=1 Tax=Procambarus clarkii TaxID=6728 RepID=UPI0037434D29
MRVQLCVLVTLLLGAASPTLSAQVGYGAGEVAVAEEFLPEDPCSAEGGLCVRESACPAGLLHPQKGLCPSQQNLGAECCYGLPDTVTDCQARGGVCRFFRDCRHVPIQDPKGKCSKGKVCCILVT